MSGGTLAIGRCVSTFYLSQFFTSSGINFCPGSWIAFPTTLCHSRTHLQIIHLSSQNAGGSNCKTVNRASKARKPLRRKALLLHLFRQHAPSNDNPNYMIQVGHVVRIYHFYWKCALMGKGRFFLPLLFFNYPIYNLIKDFTTYTKTATHHTIKSI